MIRVLDRQTANQIAAGEVVERPASVVKELIENSLDAGARCIEIRIKGGGIELIEVADDGTGIPAEHVPLALERHATSKIRTIEDLQSVTTLGFRGEALPSIASCSRLEMITSTGQGAGVRVEVHGSQLVSEKRVATRRGTVVRVRDLFYNTPARKKHLASRSTEVARITETVYAAAVAHPEVSFRLYSDNRELLFTPGRGDLMEALAAVMGPDIIATLLPLSHQDDDIKLTGYVGGRSAARSSRDRQLFFVNKRPVRDSVLREAVEDAFRGHLTTGRYPLAALFLEIHPSKVDVNVHPTKTQVRFVEPRRVYSATHRAVRETLARQKSFPQLVLKPLPRSSDVEEQPASMVKERTVERGQYEGARDLFTVTDGEPSRGLPELEPLGQIHYTYIIARDTLSGELFIVDQHAAHERIYYDALCQGDERVASQDLLFPLTLDLTPGEMAAWESAAGLLEGLGFRSEPFGLNSVIIRSAPALFAEEPADKLQEVLSHLRKMLSTVERTPDSDRARKMMASCKAAIKANQRLDRAAMAELLNQLARTKNPLTCPHGRPTAVRVPRRELERFFRRT